MTGQAPNFARWYVDQSFESATSYQIRHEVENLVRRDLLGPWDGDEEQLPRNSAGPLERYLVGRLGPRHLPKSAEEAASELPDNEFGAAGDAYEAELAEQLTIQNAGRLWASSMGLSFTVPADVERLRVTVDFGRYDLTEITDDEGKSYRTWEREPFQREVFVTLHGERSPRIPLVGDDPAKSGVHLRAEVRPSKDRPIKVVQLTLINALEEPKHRRDTAWLFQPRLTVTAPDGRTPIFLPIDDPSDATSAATLEDPEDRHLRLLYRDQLRYAWGHNVAVHAEADKHEHRAHRLETTWIPMYEVPATVAPKPDDVPQLAGLELSMDALATASLPDLRTALAPLATGYLAWLDEQASKINIPVALGEIAADAIATARNAAQRIQAGIELLTTPDHPHHQTALDAFRFANQAMALQRRHTQVVGLRAEFGLDYAEAQARVEEGGPGAASWRPFQLAFVLLNLPALTDPEHPERAADPDAIVDLLFFPTGGGKTEAYLGLAAYTFAIRRLQGVVGTGADARSGASGVAVLMRYTLRLLTAQQFQRAAALVCAAEVLRADALDKGDRRWGVEPFRIGLWVGSGVSPNWYGEAEDEVAQIREAGGRHSNRVLQTLTCPWCGTKLEAHRDLKPDRDRRRILLPCPNAEGSDACPFSAGDGLPILTVDEEIYRLAPALVVATVDKLAQLPWRGYAGILFGRVSQRCSRHGYRHGDLDDRTGCGTRHNAKGRLPAAHSQPCVRLRPPDLIIQDELHLISGALGTLVGLFEAAVDQLCTWKVGGNLAGPKIVASTATTKRAASQVRGVFGRGLAVFPPPVLDINDTFFSRLVPIEEAPGRRYIGLCAHGVRLKSAEIRLAEILLIVGQTTLDRYGEPADPYLTLVGYFNATRELAGMRRYLDDDVAIRVRTKGRARGLSNRSLGSGGLLGVQELTSRISSADISTVLKRLENRFEPSFDTTAARRALIEDAKLAGEEGREPAWRQREFDQLPVDVVLATSMLQVGVDVSRFGLMVITGQPKNTAEYIQASSRIGRDASRPGLVVTLYNWSRPRDLAHYEDFEHYHATFYRQVEALSVTPYTRQALDRGVTATLVAAVRNLDDTYSRDIDAHDVPLDGPLVQTIRQRFLDRAEAIAGARGRSYLAERLDTVTDTWQRRKQGNTRLGYRQRTDKQQQHVRGLLQPAGAGDWSELTVAQSMRETENEVNLLVPAGSGLFGSTEDQPDWSFAPSDADASDTDDIPVADELGLTPTESRRGARA